MVVGNSAGGPLAKLAVSFALSYHFLGGVRHVVWDANPNLLQSAEVTKASYALFGGSALMSLGFACI